MYRGGIDTCYEEGMCSLGIGTQRHVLLLVGRTNIKVYQGGRVVGATSLLGPEMPVGDG